MATGGCVNLGVCNTVLNNGTGIHGEKQSFTEAEQRSLSSLKDNIETAKRCLDVHVSSSNMEREKIVTTFANLRDSVERNYRAALAEFDLCVCKETKMLNAHLEGLKIHYQQLLGHISACGPYEIPRAQIARENVTPSFNSDFASVLNDLHKDFWLIVTDNDNDGHDRDAFARCVKTCDKLTEMRARLNVSRDYLSRVMIKHRAKLQSNLILNPPMSFQASLIHTICIKGGSLCGIAISPDTAHFAISENYSRSILILSTTDFKVIRRIGLFGVCPQTFRRPCGQLCFSRRADTILVADTSTCRVQEITLMGEFVRFISNATASPTEDAPIYGLDANSEVIVISNYRRAMTQIPFSDSIIIDSIITVFDADTGQFRHRFTSMASRVGNWHGLKLTPDGKGIVVSHRDLGIVSMYSLCGELVRTLEFDKWFPQGVAFTSRGEMVIVASDNGAMPAFGWPLSVYNLDSGDYKVIPKICETEDNAYYPSVCSSGGIVFVLSSSKILVFM